MSYARMQLIEKGWCGWFYCAAAPLQFFKIFGNQTKDLLRL